MLLVTVEIFTPLNHSVRLKMTIGDREGVVPSLLKKDT